MAEATFTFPADFLWGTATSAHQVEGRNSNNDWWAWEQQFAGKIYDNQCSADACSWWDGLAEADIQRMKALNNNAHRLGVEWSRIEPEPGVWDHSALDRYRAILKAMQAAGIQPMITLHHFTNPVWVAEKGGWLNPEIVDWFRRFVRKTVTDLSDLCDTWCTINEPSVLAGFSYFTGKWPPGNSSLNDYLKVAYHLLLAHAAAYEVIHDLQPLAKVGLAHRLSRWYPLRPGHPLDRVLTYVVDRSFNRLYLEALETGVYNPIIGKKLPVPQVKGTQDYIGLNYYERYNVAFRLRNIKQLGITYSARPSMLSGPAEWGEIYPEGLFELIEMLYKQFRLPIYITENGFPDERDTHRPAFLIRHLHQIWRALNFNYPVKGYYFWSLIDNFEWSEGYDPHYRFGLYNVDFKTQERTLTRTGTLYAEIAGTRTLTSDMGRRYAPEVLEHLFPGSGPNDMHRVIG